MQLWSSVNDKKNSNFNCCSLYKREVGQQQKVKLWVRVSAHSVSKFLSNNVQDCTCQHIIIFIVMYISLSLRGRPWISSGFAPQPNALCHLSLLWSNTFSPRCRISLPHSVDVQACCVNFTLLPLLQEKFLKMFPMVSSNLTAKRVPAWGWTSRRLRALRARNGTSIGE